MAQAAVEDLDGGDEDLWEAPEAVVPAPVEDGPVPIVPLAVAQGKCYCSTGYTAGGLEQCRFAWRALRVTSAEPPQRFVKAEFLFSDDGYWDWWASHPGQPSAVTERPLIHVCSENPCSVVEGPGACTELIHVADGAELGLTDLRALFVEPAAVAKAAGRPPAAAGPLRAPPGAAPFDFLSVGGSSRGPGSELAADEEAAAAGGLGGKLAGARVRFEQGKRAAGDVNLDGSPLGAEAAGEGPVKRRSLGDLLVERAAKLKRAASDAAPRGSGGPAPERAPPGAGLSGGMRELAQALVMAIREGKEALPGDIGGDGLGSSDPAAVPRDLATKRAFCRRMAAASPGRLTELSLQQMADFLGSQEGEAAVDATGPIALRYLLTIYLPQHPVKEIGVQTYREPRTLAEAVDLLMQGKAAHACDLIVQRLKALQVATTDGSWAAAKWLELIPPRDEPTAIRSEEEELIRSIQLGEMKLDELSARLASAKTPGGPPPRAEGSAAPPPWKMSFAEMRKKFPKQPGETNTQHRLRGVAEPPLATALQCWSDELSFGFGKSIVAVDLAARLVAAVRRHPGSLGNFARSFSMRADTFCGSGGSSNRRVRDALPLPLPSTEEVDRWLAHSALPKARRCRRRAVAREVSEQAWLYLSVVALNYAFCGRAQEGWRHRPTLSKAQTQVYVHLKSRAAALAEDPLAMVVVPAIDELAGGCGSAYEGESGVKALPCRLCELAPGLPARECAATLDAIDFVDDEVGAWLRRPELALLDQSDWPDPLPRARVNVETEADWEELALHLVSLGIFTTLAESELVRARGEPVLNGLFAVEKKGTPAPGATRVTRLILNMVPGNSLLKAHVGEAALLAASTSWTSVVIPEGKLLLWSGDDQKGAFFVWRVPPAWHPYMAVGRPLAGKLFGRSEPVVYVTSAVIAMGWSLAVPVFQHIHRRLCRLAPPLGAGLPPDGEWRKDCARPLVEAGSGQDAGWWQVYVDDFDAPEIVEEVLAREVVGTPSDLQLRVRASYERASVSFSAEKAHCRQLRVERMGADVDGVSGRLAVPASKALATAGLCLAAVQRRLVPWRVAMAVLGKLVRAFEFRRPLFGVLNSVWTLAASSAQGAFLDAEMVEELLMGVMVLPLAASSLRARIDGMATSSDASEMGGGVCTSAGLREDVAAALQVPRTVPDQLGIGARLLNMPEDPARPWAAANPRVPARAVRRVLSVLLIGLFDGIGGLAVAFSRLPVRIAAYVAAETDAKARRVVRLRWPGVIDWGDVTCVGSETVRDLFEAFGGLVDLVVVAAGSPRQDLSRLNVGGRGLSGRKSSLFHEVPRVLALLAAVFRDRLVWFVENVASMSDVNVELISEALQVRPTLVCSSVFVPCRRPRLFWTSWGVTASAPLRLADRGVYDELVGPGVPLMDLAWEDEGCSWPGRPRCFPTLVCCRPQPSFLSAPRGFAAASEAARQRWAADGHRYHVALYEDKNMICTSSFPFLRLPTSEERERLLGFDVGYTSLATKGSNPQDASDAGAFLLGNSFSIHVVAWLCQQLLHRRGALNRELSIEEVPPVRECWATWDQAGAFVTEPGEPDTAEARQLVLHYLSRAEKGGSDVRLDYGVPYRPRGWPRTSLDPFVWKWRVVVSMAWPGRSSTHINVRELQAATSAIRWRARKVAQHGSRFLHLVDSQVVAAIVTKGRSSSRKLQPILKRWMAVVVAADMYPLIGYVVSEDSPADEPSRPAPVRRRGTRCQTLSSLRVSAETRRRYGRALRALLAHFGAEQAGADALRGDPEDADALVAEYLEGLWASGAGIAAANNTLAGVCFAAPRLRRHLDLSWTLLRAWRHHEPASRVLPLTTEAVAAMAGFACVAGAFDVAALLLVAFEGMLRGAEVFALTVGDIVDRGELFAVRISSSKTTAGKDCAEAVVIRSRMAVALLRIAVRGLGAGARLSWRTPSQLRGALGALARGLGLAGPITWHSVRRGGASAFFVRSGSMEATLVAGRWASSATARLHIEGAVADSVRAQPGSEAARAVARGRMADGEGASAAAVGEGRTVRAGDFIQVTCYDDADAVQGEAVFRIASLYEASEHGQFARAEFLFCTDQYLQWYEENAGSPGARKLKRVLHFCPEDETAILCAAEAGPGVEVTHVDEFVVLESVEEAYLQFRRRNPAARWPAELGPEPLEEELGDPVDEELVPAELDEFGLAAKVVDSVGELEAVREAEGPGAAAGPPGRAAFKARGRPPARARPPAAAASEPAGLPGGSVRPRGTAGGETPLEAAAAAAAKEPAGRRPDEEMQALLRKRLGDLKGRLGAEGDAAAEPRGAATEGAPLKRKSLDEILAERAAKAPRRGPADGGAAGSGGLAGAGPEREGGGSTAHLLRSLLGALTPAEGIEGFGITDGLEFTPGKSSAASRAFFRRTARDTPGKLLTAHLSHLNQFLSTKGMHDAEEELPPIVNKFLLNIFLASHPVSAIGEDMFRQMLTLSESLDLLIQGKLPEAMDMLMQRFKACQLACKDKHWRSARWLELIPPDADMAAINIEEEELLRKIEYGELKLAELAGKLKTFKELKLQNPKKDGETQGKYRQRLALLMRGDGPKRQAPPVQGGARKVILEGEGSQNQVMLTNYQYAGTCGEEAWGHHSHYSAAQANAVEVMREAVSYFLRGDLGRVQLPLLSEISTRASSAYDIDSGTRALPLRLGELRPGLPAADVAGRLDPRAHVSPEVLTWLDDPSVALLPRAQWPSEVPKARLLVDSPAEWARIVGHLYSLGIVEAIEDEQIFRADGVPVLNGAFAVEKRGVPEAGEQRQCRFIMNMVPANSYLKIMTQDLSTLTASTSWVTVVLEGQRVLLWSGDDQQGAFFVWKIPRAWRSFTTLKGRVPGRLVGRPDLKTVHVCSAVIPMGWLLAVTLFQHLHRRLGLRPPPAGAGLPEFDEWRRDRPLPIAQVGGCRSWYQFFIDDFDAPRIVNDTEGEVGVGSAYQKRQRASYQRNGVAWAERKAHLGETKVERMGVLVDGLRGRVSVPLMKLFETMLLGALLVTKDWVYWKTMLVLLGKLVRALEFRRVLFCILNEVWKFADGTHSGWVNSEMTEEILSGVGLLPLAFTDLRAEVDARVTCSDASEDGGGACTSLRLCPEALSKLTAAAAADQEGRQHLMAGRLLLGEASLWRAWESRNPGLPPPAGDKIPAVLVIGLFDGIGGMIVSLSRLRTKIIGYVSSEVDPSARRVVRKRWPGHIDWGNIKDVGTQHIDKLVQLFGGIVDVVYCGAGSPCQDLSRLMFGRRGLEGQKSALFREIPRILGLLNAAFPGKVRSLIENVASMPFEDIERISSELQVTPYRFCSSCLVPNRRPRLYWLSWRLLPCKGYSYKDRGHFVDVISDGAARVELPWTSPGWIWNGGPLPVPTLVCARPSLLQPTRPAGIARASPEAKARWKKDDHRYHVGLYENACLLQHEATMELRPPSAEEREVLLGFDRGYTECAVKDGSSSSLETTRCFLLGNSFSVYAVSWLLQHSLVADEFQPQLWEPHALCHTGKCRAPWNDSAVYHQGDDYQYEPEAEQLVRHYLSIAERGGTDVRLDVHLPFRHRAWPRVSLEPSVWTWKVISSYRWRAGIGKHINALEIQAAVNTIKWRLRSGTGRPRRMLHLIDSQVAASVLTKGRSSSRVLRMHVKRWGALCWATGCYVMLGYIASEDNPADALQRLRGSQRLSDLRVSAVTLKRYRIAVAEFLAFAIEGGFPLNSSAEADSALGAYVEDQWANEGTLSHGRYALAGCLFFAPELRTALPFAWSLVKTWQKLAPINRAYPASPEMALGLAGAAVSVGQPLLAALVLVTFDAMLRTKELRDLTYDDITFAEGGVILRLPETKMGVRTGKVQFVVVRTPAAVNLLRAAAERAQPTDHLCPCTYVQLQRLLKSLLAVASIPPARWSWYSF
ncbi:unnamed protein product, partial [Prorocentrum cordatum]